MNKLDSLKSCCTGCKLCASILNVNFIDDAKGFPQPQLKNSDIEFCDLVCPASAVLWKNQTGEIWGDYKEVYLGWSKDEIIRKQASSGGIITAMCLYLLDHKIVDGIVQTRMSHKVPYVTETVISRNKEEVMQCVGSRYSISYPLEKIKQIINPSERYCFIGKPCDVYSLKAFMSRDKAIADSIIILMSFFCAGMPSVDAQKKLLNRLECRVEDCIDLRYRGNGWPGFATAKSNSGKETKISYHESWGEILGRDIRRSCRLCIDGVGTFADIACGDAWYLKNGKPDFTEGDGRNVIFSRSDLGTQLLTDAMEKGYIHLDNYNEQINELSLIQKHQYMRKASMRAMIAAMRITGFGVPHYPTKISKLYASNVGHKIRIKRFWGTLKRIILGKI